MRWGPQPKATQLFPRTIPPGSSTPPQVGRAGPASQAEGPRWAGLVQQLQKGVRRSSREPMTFEVQASDVKHGERAQTRNSGGNLWWRPPLTSAQPPSRWQPSRASVIARGSGTTC